MVHGWCSVIPTAMSNLDYGTMIPMGGKTHHVAPISIASGQNEVASKPAHMIAEPPDMIGARRLRTMPPTWKRGIMFTAMAQLASYKVSSRSCDRTLTVNILMSQIPGDDNSTCTDNEGTKSVRNDLLLPTRTRSMKNQGVVLEGVKAARSAHRLSLLAGDAARDVPQHPSSRILLVLPISPHPPGARLLYMRR
jgi:hypothetical protein